MDLFAIQVAGVPLAIVLLMGLILALLFTASLNLVVSDGSRRQRDKRIGRMVKRVRHDTDAEKAAAITTVRRQDSSSGFDRIASRLLPNPEVMRQRLARTGRSISIGGYILICTLIFALVSGAVYVFADLSPLLCVPIGLIIGLGVPHIVVGTMIRNRRQRFLSLFPEAIDLIVRGVKSGMPVTESLRTVAAEIEDPVGVEFRTVNDQLNLGTSLERALWDIAERLDIPEFRFFVVSLSVQAETGGNLAETLENLSDILRKRRAAKMKVRALSSEARASALIIGVLPFLMFGILFTINPEYMGTLLDDVRGQIMLGIGLSWMGMGFLIMKRMVTFEI